ncbi:MAG: TolC family protein [Candidatus Omnitrophica bacterium]|nr:TolC family protein [Candidatus Omnitrophota bacterium]
MVRKTEVFIILLCFLMYIKGASADEALTWQECVQKALEHNPALSSAAESVKQSQADSAIALSSMLPEVSSEGSGRTAKSAGSDEQDAYGYSVSGRQLIFDGFSSYNELKDADEALKAAEYNYAVTSSDTRLDLKSAFVNLLKVEQLIQLTEDIAQRRNQNLELVKLRYEAGREHKGSLLTAEADLAQANFEATQAKRSLNLAQREMIKQLGLSDMQSVKVQGDFEVEEDCQAKPDFELLADSTPFLKELIAEKEAARYNLRSNKGSFFPEIYLGATVGKSGANWEPRDTGWSANVSVSLPLFEGGSRIAGLKKAQSQFRQAKEDLRSGRDSVLYVLEEAWIDFQDSIDKVQVEKKYLDATEERAKIAQAQYSTGLITFDDWTIIEDALVSDKKAYLNSLADALIAEAYWVQAKGGTLEDEKE